MCWHRGTCGRVRPHPGPPGPGRSARLGGRALLGRRGASAPSPPPLAAGCTTPRHGARFARAHAHSAPAQAAPHRAAPPARGAWRAARTDIIHRRVLHVPHSPTSGMQRTNCADSACAQTKRGASLQSGARHHCVAARPRGAARRTPPARQRRGVDPRIDPPHLPSRSLMQRCRRAASQPVRRAAQLRVQRRQRRARPGVGVVSRLCRESDDGAALAVCAVQRRASAAARHRTRVARCAPSSAQPAAKKKGGGGGAPADAPAAARPAARPREKHTGVKLSRSRSSAAACAATLRARPAGTSAQGASGEVTALRCTAGGARLGPVRMSTPTTCARPMRSGSGAAAERCSRTASTSNGQAGPPASRCSSTCAGAACQRMPRRRVAWQAPGGRRGAPRCATRTTQRPTPRPARAARRSTSLAAPAPQASAARQHDEQQDGA